MFEEEEEEDDEGGGTDIRALVYAFAVALIPD